MHFCIGSNVWKLDVFGRFTHVNGESKHICKIVCYTIIGYLACVGEPWKLCWTLSLNLYNMLVTRSIIIHISVAAGRSKYLVLLGTNMRLQDQQGWDTSCALGNIYKVTTRYRFLSYAKVTNPVVLSNTTRASEQFEYVLTSNWDRFTGLNLEYHEWSLRY